MRILKTSEYEIGKECKVSSSVGFLVVRLIESFPGLGAFLFEWRFESDTAWTRVEVSTEEDVIDKVYDLAEDIYQHTGRCQQPDIYRPMWRPGKSEPEPLQVRYEGAPLTATVPMGQPPSATEWAMQWGGVRPPMTPIATVSNRDGKTHLNGQLMEEGKYYNAGGVFDAGRSSFDWGAAMQRTLDDVNKHDNTAGRSRATTPIPIVYDKDCPFDYEHEAGGVLLVGNKERATHRALHIESVEGEPFKQRVVTAPLEFPNIPGVPKPTYNFAPLTDEFNRYKGATNKARGILKHGPYGSGESGPCDENCAKCAHEKPSTMQRFVLAQRELAGRGPRRLTSEQRAEASSQWSAQLRVKVAEQKERDAEAARYTPWWSPEEQSGGDL